LISLFKNLKDKTVIIVSHQEKIIECANNIIVLDNDGVKQFNKKQAISQIKKLQCGKLGGNRG
jgi:ABC-type transport system involved in cytochrome bd biosynthesis fused ATPase/permease subunit